MTPQTTSMLMRRTRCDTARTKPIETIAPRNAAAFKAADEAVCPRDKSMIIVTAIGSFAPEEMPRTKGPAMGLWKNVCSR